MNSRTPVVGVLLSRARVEEKLLLQELASRGVETKTIDDRALVLPTETRPDLGVDVVLERCIQHGTALYALSVLDGWGIPTVNTYETAEVCGNKLLTTMRLVRDDAAAHRLRRLHAERGELRGHRAVLGEWPHSGIGGPAAGPRPDVAAPAARPVDGRGGAGTATGRLSADRRAPADA